MLLIPSLHNSSTYFTLNPDLQKHITQRTQIPRQGCMSVGLVGRATQHKALLATHTHHHRRKNQRLWKATDFPEGNCFAGLIDSKTSSANWSSKVNNFYMNQSSEAVTRLFCVYFQSVFNKYFKVTVLGHGWFVERKKSLLVQHYKHQKNQKMWSYEKTAIQEDKC